LKDRLQNQLAIMHQMLCDKKQRPRSSNHSRPRSTDSIAVLFQSLSKQTRDGTAAETTVDGAGIISDVERSLSML